MNTLSVRLSFQDLCWGLVLGWLGAMRAMGERINARTRRCMWRKARRTVAKHMFPEGR